MKHLFTILILGSISSITFAGDKTLHIQHPDVKAISVGYSHTCAIISDGTLRCFGADTAALIPPRGQFTSIASGSEISCALDSRGHITCWGDYLRAYPPTAEFTQIDAQDSGNLCGIRYDGVIKCWPHRFNYSVPEGSFNVVSVGEHFACGIRTDSTIACWKDTETSDNTRITPPKGQFKAIDSNSWDFSCALDLNNQAKCWGRAAEIVLNPPSDVFNSITIGYSHACGLKPDGYVVCWGRNDKGQTIPPKNDGPYRAISAGMGFTCGIRINGTVVCWGDNSLGQFGLAPLLKGKDNTSGNVGHYYAFKLLATANPDVSHYAILEGNLPPGLSLDEKSGLISGIPTQPGIYTMRVTASNEIHTPAMQTISIKIVD